MRRHLSFANVCSLLALFVALGGSAYAAALITSADVKNRSLRGIDIKKNAVKGSEVKEPSLGKVPKATNADFATNAATLDDLSPSAFESSSRIQYGTGNSKGNTQTVLFEWPEADVQIRADGDADANNEVRVMNTRPGNEGDLAVVPENGSTVPVTEQTATEFDGGPGSTLELTVVDPGSSRTLFVDCVFPAVSTTPVNCYGIRSQAIG